MDKTLKAPARHRRRAVAALVAAGLLGALAPAAGAETGSVTVNGSSLSLTTAAIGFGTVTLTGLDLTDTIAEGDVSWTAKDPRGTGAGWNVTAYSTDFGIDEVQTVTVSGGPTGGSFTLTFSAQTTAAIAYDAAASAVEAAIEALSNVDDVTVTGSAGGPYTVTFVSPGKQNVAQMTATSSLTGGTSPAVAVATTTAGKLGVNVSATDSRFKIGVTDLGGITNTAGNTDPTSSVTSLTNIPEGSASPLKIVAAAADTGMGTYEVKPSFSLDIPAETYADSYTATVMLTVSTGP